MRSRLDAKVRTSDGHAAGHVRRAVFDPSANEVSGFVIDTGGLLGHEVMVSRGALDRAGSEGDEVIMDLTRDELRGLERYEAGDFGAVPAGWVPPTLYDYPAAMYLFPLRAGAPAVRGRARPARAAITKGMTVRDPSGRAVGVVKERDPSGGGVTRDIPADQVDVGGGEVRLIEGAVPRAGVERD